MSYTVRVDRAEPRLDDEAVYFDVTFTDGEILSVTGYVSLEQARTLTRDQVYQAAWERGPMAAVAAREAFKTEATGRPSAERPGTAKRVDRAFTPATRPR